MPGKILTIIPARGGSKRIPRKNLAIVGGKPLIYWAITAAFEAGLEPIVSTDDDEIASVSADLGARILKRPGFLSCDDTSGMAVARHAVASSFADDCTSFVYLQPTSPLRTAEDIKAGLCRINSACIAVEARKRWSVFSQFGGHVSGPITTNEYHLCGAFFGASIPYFWEHGWYGPRTAMLIIPQERALDVDEPWDLRIADAALSNRL